MWIRRSAGLWLGVAVAVASWLVVGLRMTAVSCGAAVGVSMIADALGRARRSPSRRERLVRSERLAVPIAGVSWALAAAADLAAPAARVIGAARDLHPLRGAPAVALAHGHLAAPWPVVVDVLVGGALISSLLAARALRRPAKLGGGSTSDELDRARAIVEEHGEDSLSPFILRPDKSFEFAAGGVAAYRMVGETAVVSGDPVGPDGSAAESLGRLLRRARQAGVRLAVYGGSERHLETYRTLGLRVMRVGEEAVVEPGRFTLEGRPVRKLRQSVHRMQRRGWRITIHEGRDIDGRLEAAIDEVEAAWRGGHDRMLGFAMSMGEFELGVRPRDVYALAWSPDDRLQAVMRFLAHRGRLSLDTMRRVGDTPNGLNEALVCHVLQFARDRGVHEVSLNYAGLGHLVRGGPSGNGLVRAFTRILMRPLRSRFQMDRLVLFNQKFSPAWRPRYLVYESRAALPRTVFRVLQAEGYLPQRGTRRAARQAKRWRAHTSSPPIEGGVSG
jgi:lysyl-tRNA synthetase, class II